MRNINKTIENCKVPMNYDLKLNEINEIIMPVIEDLTLDNVIRAVIKGYQLGFAVGVRAAKRGAMDSDREKARKEKAAKALGHILSITQKYVDYIPEYEKKEPNHHGVYNAHQILLWMQALNTHAKNVAKEVKPIMTKW